MLCVSTRDRVGKMNIKTYSKLILLPTFIERFNYLKLGGQVGMFTFGSKRYLNQLLYQSEEWKAFRRQIIIRDNGCDLGILDRELDSYITVHHINPITVDEVLDRSWKIFDPENVITTSTMTHKALHYGDENLLIQEPIIRRVNDTCPWKY